MFGVSIQESALVLTSLSKLITWNPDIIGLGALQVTSPIDLNNNTLL